MSDIVNIAYYYDQANIELKNNNSDLAKSLFLQSWQTFNYSESTFIPDEYIKIAHKALEKYRELSDMDGSEFDNIVYGV